MAFATGFSFGPGGSFGYAPAPQNAPQQPMQGGRENAQFQGPTRGPGGMGYDPYGQQGYAQQPGYPPQQPQQMQPQGMSAQNNGVPQPPTLPSQAESQRFLPPIFQDPYVNSINNAQNVTNWSSQAIPGAAAFQADIYNPGMTGMEQAYAGSAAELGSRNLAKTHNRLAGMFENSASHGELAPAFLDATNQFNAQLNQMIGQMGTQRQQTAAQLTPFTMGFPLQAGQAGQQAAQGLYDMGQNAMYGDLNFPLAALGSNPYSVPSIIAS